MKNVRLNLEVPAQSKETSGSSSGSSAFVRVGVIALLGFGVGVAWPRAMGLQLGPAPIPSLAGTAEPEVRELLNAAGAGTAGPTASAAPSSSAPPAAGPVSIVIAKGVVLSCKNSDGEVLKGRECGGAPKGFDPFVSPHLSKLATCSGAAGQQGKLSAVITFDYRASKLSVEVGKSSTVPSPEPIGKCLKEAFSGVDLPNTPHEHGRYAMAYSVQFDGSAAKGAPSAQASTASSNTEPPDEASPDTAPSASASSAPSGPILAGSTAELEWEPTRVRNAPRTGEIIARWPKGTKVTILSQQGGWLKVKREGTSEEGWVYRSALGK